MLQHIPLLSDYNKGNGVCRYLVNNLCCIYQNRPLFCNIEQMYLSIFKDTFTKQEFIKMNIEACIQIAEYFSDESVKQQIINIKNQYECQTN